MTATNHRTCNRTMIPWVIALVALIGLNAIVSEHSRGRMREVSDEIGLSQIADDAQTLARTANPLLLFTPDCSETSASPGLSSRLLSIETGREHPVATVLGGAIRGRAPPGGVSVS